MYIAASAELHFHKQDQLSVYLESNSVDRYEDVGEIGLLITLTLRVFYDLQDSREAQALVDFIAQGPSAVLAFANGQETGGVELIPYPGRQGRKRFYVVCKLLGDQISIDVKSRGFGLIGTGLPYYGPVAIVGLLRYLAAKHATDTLYLEGLAEALSFCASTYIDRAIELPTLPQTASACIAASCAGFLCPTDDQSNQPQIAPCDNLQSKGYLQQPTAGTLLPATIDAADERYDIMGIELDLWRQQADGAKIARTLHAHFEQDLRDWLYGCVLPYFSLPEDQMSNADVITAEFYSRNTVSFFQSVRAASAAAETGCIPLAKLKEFTDWLLRLNLGQQPAAEATQNWLQDFNAPQPAAQLPIFSDMLAQRLPNLHGKAGIIQLYSHTLDLRIKATTLLAFSHQNQAQQLRAEAVEFEQRLDLAIQRYSRGGAHCFVLESDQGLLITKSKEYGTLFHLWTEEQLATEINDNQYSGQFRVLTMGYRELHGQLQYFASDGLRYVTVDRRSNGDFRILPLEQLTQIVAAAVEDFDASDPAKIIKNALDS